jgi:DNA primase
VARYTPDSKERVREAADFVELVSAYTDLRRAGPNRYEGLCPFHEERTPSFGIDPDRKLYHCFGCGASGDVFTFVEATQQLDFKGALEYLADRYGVDLEREGGEGSAGRDRRERLYALLERAARFYERQLHSTAGTAARHYLKRRGLEEGTVQLFRLGWAPAGWDRLTAAAQRAGFTPAELEGAGLASRGKGGSFYDRFRARVIFPLCDERGRVIGFGGRLLEGEGPKYVNSPEGDLYHKGRFLYAHHLAREEAARKGYVILCEGYMDVIALHQAGFRNAVALMGTALTDRQVRTLGRLAKRVLLALDGDTAGQQAALRAAAVAREAALSLEVVRLPEEGGKGLDPAEVIERWGAEAFAQALAAAVPLERFSVERILARHDLESGQGRDRAVAELGPVVASLPPSNLRSELVAYIAERLGGLSVAIVERLLAQAAGRGERQPGAKRPVLGQLLTARQRIERAFLALCLALPAEGQKALAEIKPDRHLTDRGIQRVAEYLRRCDLHNPTAGVAGLDRDLESALSAVVAEAQALRERPLQEGEGEGERLARLRSQLRSDLLQLELAALDRQIRTARQRGEPVAPLALRRAEVKEAFDEVQGEAYAPALPASNG